MQRRQLLHAATRLALLGGGAFMLQQAQAQPSYTVTAEQMREALAKKFPRRYKAGGFLALDMQAPALRLLPKENRLGADIQLEASGPALPERHAGVFDLDFALRYEASDQSIRAHQLKVNTLRFSGMPPRQAELLTAYGPVLAEQALRDVVLHQLRPQDLMLADGLGLEPGTITVTARGLVVGFVNKPAR
ncbi:MAG: DUF1439 domain-containing protein [Polaromonas sp.]|nr:DUF1439 domain-containing protein [Polaromonas sp.]